MNATRLVSSRHPSLRGNNEVIDMTAIIHMDTVKTIGGHLELCATVDGEDMDIQINRSALPLPLDHDSVDLIELLAANRALISDKIEREARDGWSGPISYVIAH
jgi:hypothetical protein